MVIECKALTVMGYRGSAHEFLLTLERAELIPEPGASGFSALAVSAMEPVTGWEDRNAPQS